METQTIVIILFALLVAVLVLTCVCVDGAAKAAKVQTIGREKVKAAATFHGCRPPFLFTPDYDGALVGYVHDKYMNSILAVYSAELLEALMANSGTEDPKVKLAMFEMGGKLGAVYPLVVHTK